MHLYISNVSVVIVSKSQETRLSFTAKYKNKTTENSSENTSNSVALAENFRVTATLRPVGLN